jgi:hypothetical protein
LNWSFGLAKHADGKRRILISIATIANNYQFQLNYDQAKSLKDSLPMVLSSLIADGKRADTGLIVADSIPQVYTKGKN